MRCIRPPRASFQTFAFNAAVAITVLTATSAAASAGTEVNHGPIKSFEMPDGWVSDKSNGFGLDPRQKMLYFKGPRPGSAVTFRLIRKPGTNLSSAFSELLKQPPHPLTPAQANTVKAIISKQPTDLVLIQTYQQNEPEIALEKPETVSIGGRTVVKAFRSSYFYGCSRSAAINGAYNTMLILADADGTASSIEEISFTAKVTDFDVVSKFAQQSLAKINWKSANGK